MASAREDYLSGLLTEMAVTLRRLRERLHDECALTAPHAPVLAALSHEAAAAIATLLGDRAGLVQMLDATSAARLVGTREIAKLWSGFLRVRADAERAQGHADVAERLTMRAAALEVATMAAWPDAMR